MTAVPREWTRAEVIDAICDYAEEHGGPPTHRAWHRSDPSRPTSHYITEHYGWANMIEAAGFPRPKKGPAYTRRPSGDDKPIPMSGREAELYGAIVTFENSAGEILVLHRAGPPGRVVKDLCHQACALDESFRVVSVSTPTSIHTDLKGHRADSKGRFGAKPKMPESRIVPVAMIHPRLWAACG